MKRILVTGSRDWDSYSQIAKQLAHYEGFWGPELITLVSGACPTGADSLAELAAELLYWEIERHPAEWDKYGKSAGFRRNAEMVNLGADVCLAFIRNGSLGASMTARLAEKAGIEVKRFTVDDR